MRVFLTVLLLFVIGCRSHGAASPPLIDAAQASANAPTWQETRARVHDYENVLSGVMWRVMHCYSTDDWRPLLETLSKVVEAVKKDQPELLDGVQKRLLALMDSRDDTVSGASAVILGVLGDRRVIPAIEKNLHANNTRKTDSPEIIPPTAKGEFAIALGMLDDRDAIPQIIALFERGNEYERRGAALALGYLKDRSHAKLLVDALLKRDSFVEQPSLLSALAMMDATDFVDEIAGICTNRFCGLDTEQALFRTLVALHATHQAGRIAKHLHDDDVFAKGDAAKALALLGAKEYGPDIVRLLSDKDELVQKDAAIALGVLGDPSYAESVSRLLQAKQEYVRYYAAFALVMMNDHTHARAAVAIIDPYHAQGYHFHEGDLPVGRKEFELLKARFDRQLADLRKP